jgi:hypothetical protein
VTYCLVQGGWGGAGNIDEDPLLVDPAGGNRRLSPGSPAIDAADTTAVPPGITDDRDGNRRFVDDPCTVDTGVPDGTNAPVDMGAYEFQPPCPADLDCSGAVDFSDLLALLLAWGPCAGCPADLDGNDAVDLLDLQALVSEWGRCP